MQKTEYVSTGYNGLDSILDGLRIGDNVVFKVDRIEDYRYFVGPFVDQALVDGKRICYMRFGAHDPIVDISPRIQVYEFDPSAGFESFATQVHRVIKTEGKRVFYVFDSLSDLLSAWATDQMVGNFFRVTCPYLFGLDTVAYFGLLRRHHSSNTVEKIRDTTQVLIDIFHIAGHFHILPLKVWQRSSTTMYLAHRKQGDQFIPLINSYETSQLHKELYSSGLDNSLRQLDHWHILFLEAEKLLDEIGTELEQAQMIRHICRHIVGDDEKLLSLAIKHFNLPELINIKNRMIGTGFIGGKALGMLLAHSILAQDRDCQNYIQLEPHDSFHVATNVYYSYIVHNNLWPLYMQQKEPGSYFIKAGELRREILIGVFPEEIREGFMKMLDYFGQYPIIIRSSSLLEDGFGNAFAGKYDSYFCVNQGSPEERLEKLEQAVRKIFASTMSEEALTYRLQRGLDKHYEQMALLIQRVSGSYYGSYYFPQLAGVGISYNPFVWDPSMNPQAGMLRLVFGLGTRAVDRSSDDYPRVVALDAPHKKQHKDAEDTRQFSQHDVDVLNIRDNSCETLSFNSLAQKDIEIAWHHYAVLDHEIMERQERRGRPKQNYWLLTLDHILEQKNFNTGLQCILKTLEKEYNYPVDIEFTVNFGDKTLPYLNIVQCRPLQTKGALTQGTMPRLANNQGVLFRTEGHFMGGNISQSFKWLVWVDAAEYTKLSLQEKYATARLIGQLNKKLADRSDSPAILLGPGRWGSTTPSMGVPISFAEINNFSVIGEIAFSRGNLMPELSFGSHFFQDLVEADIFYVALFPDSEGCFIDNTWISEQANELEIVLSRNSDLGATVKVIRIQDRKLTLIADIISQQLICFSTAPKIC